MKKILSIALLSIVIFVNANISAMCNDCKNNNSGTNSCGLDGSEKDVKNNKDDKAKEVLAREKIENRKKFFGKVASLAIATASVGLCLGSAYLTNMGNKKVSGIQCRYKRFFYRSALAIGSFFLPVLGMGVLYSAKYRLGKYTFEENSIGSFITKSLPVVSYFLLFVNNFLKEPMALSKRNKRIALKAGVSYYALITALFASYLLSIKKEDRGRPGGKDTVSTMFYMFGLLPGVPLIGTVALAEDFVFGGRAC